MKKNICKPDYGQIKLTKDMFEQGSFNELSSVKNYYETKTSTSHNLQLKRIRLIDPIPVKPNTKYIVNFTAIYYNYAKMHFGGGVLFHEKRQEKG